MPSSVNHSVTDTEMRHLAANVFVMYHVRGRFFLLRGAHKQLKLQNHLLKKVSGYWLKIIDMHRSRLSRVIFLNVSLAHSL